MKSILFLTLLTTALAQKTVTKTVIVTISPPNCMHTYAASVLEPATNSNSNSGGNARTNYGSVVAGKDKLAAYDSNEGEVAGKSSETSKISKTSYAGTEADSNADYKAGSNSGANADYKAGTNADYKAESNAGSKTDSKAGTNAGANADYKAESNAGSKTDSKAGSKTGAGTKPGCPPGHETHAHCQ